MCSHCSGCHTLIIGDSPVPFAFRPFNRHAIQNADGSRYCPASAVWGIKGGYMPPCHPSAHSAWSVWSAHPGAVCVDQLSPAQRQPQWVRRRPRARAPIRPRLARRRHRWDASVRWGAISVYHIQLTIYGKHDATPGFYPDPDAFKAPAELSCRCRQSRSDAQRETSHGPSAMASALCLTRRQPSRTHRHCDRRQPEPHPQSAQSSLSSEVRAQPQELALVQCRFI